MFCLDLILNSQFKLMLNARKLPMETLELFATEQRSFKTGNLYCKIS